MEKKGLEDITPVLARLVEELKRMFGDSVGVSLYRMMLVKIDLDCGLVQKEESCIISFFLLDYSAKDMGSNELPTRQLDYSVKDNVAGRDIVSISSSSPGQLWLKLRWHMFSSFWFGRTAISLTEEISSEDGLYVSLLEEEDKFGSVFVRTASNIEGIFRALLFCYDKESKEKKHGIINKKKKSKHKCRHCRHVKEIFKFRVGRPLLTAVFYFLQFRKA